MLGAVGEHEDISSSSVRVSDVGADLPGPVLVGGHPPEDCLHRGVFRGVGVRQGVVHDEIPADEHRRRRVLGHGVANGPELHVKNAFKAVAPAGSGGQAQPPAVGSPTHAALEGHRRQVVALVDDDEPVTLEHISDILASRQRLKGDEVDYAATPRTPGAELADVPLL